VRRSSCPLSPGSITDRSIGSPHLGHRRSPNGGIVRSRRCGITQNSRPVPGHHPIGRVAGDKSRSRKGAIVPRRAALKIGSRLNGGGWMLSPRSCPSPQRGRRPLQTQSSVARCFRWQPDIALLHSLNQKNLRLYLVTCVNRPSRA